jgi:predicted nucleotidyltransferase
MPIRDVAAPLANIANRIEQWRKDDLGQRLSRPYWFWDDVETNLRVKLLCGALLNDLVTGAANGEFFAPGYPFRRVAYHAGLLSTRDWRGTAVRVPAGAEGSAASTLLRFLTQQSFTLRKLFVALKQADKCLQFNVAGAAQTPQPIKFFDAAAAEPETQYFRSTFGHVEEHVSIYVHGSAADNTRTAFSDYDDLVVLHQSAWRDWDTFAQVMTLLDQASRELQLIDPLQHHGHILLLEYDLSYLDQAILPLIAIEDARRLVGRSEIRFKASSDIRGLGSNLWAVLQECAHDLRSLVNGNARPFQLKRLVSGISLIPALSFQVDGIMIGKAAAIREARSLYSGRASEAVEWASALRLQWGSIFKDEVHSRLMRLQQRLPIRRPALESLGTRYGSRIDLERLPNTSSTTVTAICSLIDESLTHLCSVDAKNWSRRERR